jgi:hypothetical protein
MMNTKNRPAKVSRGILVLTSVLLAGILTLAYGYTRTNALVLYAGLAVTAMGVAAGAFRIVVYGRV